MRATRAYIASAGTAAVMLGAALCMLVLVSAFVAFGAWPGEKSGSEVDQVLLSDVVAPKAQKVAVGEQAINVARRADAKRRVALARAERRAKKRGGTTPDGNAVAKTPSTTAGAGGPVAAVPGGTSPTDAIKQKTDNVTQNVTNTVDQTTQQVTDNVQNTVDQTTTQVNQVVDQVQQQTSTAVQQVTDTVTDTTGTVTNTVTGTTGGLLGG